MKKELPIAILLLACAIAAWVYIAPGSARAVFNQISGRTVSALPAAGLSAQAAPMPASPTKDSSDNTAFGLGAAPATTPFGGAMIVPNPHAVRPMRTLAFHLFSNLKFDARTNQAVADLGDQINRIPALATQASMKCQLFGASVNAAGKYFQSEGGRKSRLELNFARSSLRNLLQLSDGRYVYTVKTGSKQQRLEFIDLSRLHRRDELVSPANPLTGWVLGGGIGTTLKLYANAFNFQHVEDAADRSRIIYRGIWRPVAIRRLLFSGDQVDPIPTQMAWKDTPRQIPHAVEMTFTRHPSGFMQPKEIAFFQFQTHHRRPVAQEVVRFVFDSFQVNSDLPEDLFSLESSNLQAVDMTEQYNVRLQELHPDIQGVDKVAETDPALPNLR